MVISKPSEWASTAKALLQEVYGPHKPLLPPQYANVVLPFSEKVIPVWKIGADGVQEIVPATTQSQSILLDATDKPLESSTCTVRNIVANSITVRKGTCLRPCYLGCGDFDEGFHLEGISSAGKPGARLRGTRGGRELRTWIIFISGQVSHMALIVAISLVLDWNGLDTLIFQLCHCR